MRRLTLRCAFMALALSAPAPAFAQQAPEAEPEPAEDTLAVEPAIDAGPDPIELMTASAEFLAAQPAFSFRWFASFDQVIEGREKLTFLRSGVNTMVRDVGFVSLTERGDTLRDYYYDGEVFTVASHDQNFYASVGFDRGFEALVDAVRERSGNVVPLWSLMSRSLPDRFADDIEGSAYVGTTLVAGERAHHLAFTSYDEDWQIWISTDPDRPLPLLIVGTDPYQQGWPQYRAYATDWNLEPDTDPEQFVFVPEEDDLPVSFPALEAAAEPEIRGVRGTAGPDGSADSETDEEDAGVTEEPAQ